MPPTPESPSAANNTFDAARLSKVSIELRAANAAVKRLELENGELRIENMLLRRRLNEPRDEKTEA